MKKIFVVLAGLIFTTGCASIRTDSSNPSLQSPMITKPGTLGFQAELGSSDRIKFTDDASARPPNISLVHSRSNDGRANVSYGINDRFDIGAGVTSSAGVNLTSRFRLSGDDKSVWSTAGPLSANFAVSDKSRDKNGEFGPGGYNWSAKASSTLVALGVAVGYRASEKILLIANAGYGETRAQLEIEQDPANGDLGGNYSSDIKAPLHNLGFGIALGRETFVTLGVMYTHKQWKDTTLGDTSTTHAILKFETY